MIPRGEHRSWDLDSGRYIYFDGVEGLCGTASLQLLDLCDTSNVLPKRPS